MQKKVPFLAFLSGKLALDNAPAFCDDKSERWLRYGALREQIRVLTPLWHLPKRKRGLIMCALPRTINGALTYLSAVNSGHALLLVDPDTAKLDLFIKRYQPDWVIIPSELDLGESYTPADWPIKELLLWRRIEPSESEPHPDLFLMLMPPGPPEATKAVRLSYKNISCCLDATLQTMPFTQETRSLIHMPLSYSFGLSVLHMTLAGGGRAIFTERAIKDRKLWDTARDRGVTLFAGVPFHYEHLARAGLSNLHIPQVKSFLQAGGRIPVERTQELLRQIKERDGQFYILYGQTEAGPRISILPLHEYPEKIGSVGHVIKGGALRLEGDYLIYQGENVMMGYAEGHADIPLGDTQGNTLQTGDTGRIDEDGFLYLD